jgi:Cu-Zn family superoxide dismutase
MRSNTAVTLLAIAVVTLGGSGWALREPSPSAQPTPSAEPSGAHQGHRGETPTPGTAAPSTAAPPTGTPSNALPSGAAPPGQAAQVAFTSANFEKYQKNADAITYKPALIPIGADVSALSTSRPEGRTTVLLTAHGLLPNHRYGAHVHQKSCGAKGDDAGPHYQNTADPVQPSVNPAYANPRNEIWLDFATDKDGNATAASTVGWKFTDRRPRSIVVHAEHTQTHAGHAGVAGDRLGCVNVDF